RCGGGKIHTGALGGSQHGQAVERPVEARQLQSIAYELVENLGLDLAGVGAQRALNEPRLRVGMATEAADPADAMRRRRLDEATVVRIVVVEDGDAVAVEALEDLRLGIGNRFDRWKEFEMGRLDGRDDRDLRPHLA